MFLTRMELNRARRKTPELLTNRQHMHAAVMAAFGSGTGGEGRVLWRVDATAHDPVLYLVSPAEPDLTHLVEQAGRPATQGWRTADYIPFLNGLTRGQQWAFRLHANPTHRARTDRMAADAPTKPLGHVTAGRQRDWLVSRGEQLGVRWAEVPGIGPEGGEVTEPLVTVVDRATVRFRRRDAQVTLTTAAFTGRLEVVDPEALRRALTHGIGRAKGYGCGLMTLARPR